MIKIIKKTEKGLPMDKVSQTIRPSQSILPNQHSTPNNHNNTSPSTTASLEQQPKRPDVYNNTQSVIQNLEADQSKDGSMPQQSTDTPTLPHNNKNHFSNGYQKLALKDESMIEPDPFNLWFMQKKP